MGRYLSRRATLCKSGLSKRIIDYSETFRTYLVGGVALAAGLPVEVPLGLGAEVDVHGLVLVKPAPCAHPRVGFTAEKVTRVQDL